jgi:hypothetical protein
MMLTCPLCKNELPDVTPRCPRCQADLSLLSQFVTDLKTLLNKADAHRKAGEIGAAVQAYLDVLDIDPANADARDALGPVLRAVRTAERIRRPNGRLISISQVLAILAVVVGAFVLGYWVSFLEMSLKR